MVCIRRMRARMFHVPGQAIGHPSSSDPDRGDGAWGWPSRAPASGKLDPPAESWPLNDLECALLRRTGAMTDRIGAASALRAP